MVPPTTSPPRLARLGMALAVLILARDAWAQAPAIEPSPSIQLPITWVLPDDPLLEYTEFTGSSIGPAGASFDRSIIDWFGNQHSPGTRVNFRTDANRVVVHVDYVGPPSQPGFGIFKVEVDGQLQPGQFGSDSDVGLQRFEVAGQRTNAARDLSLIFPYGRNVDLLGIELRGGTAGLLGAPQPRPASLYVAHGDSITHGYKATSTTAAYPYRVGTLLDARVINLGFAGRVVDPDDGAAIAGVGADCVSLAIGVNDFLGVLGATPAAVFRQNYIGLLDNIRAIQPSVTVLALTPAWSATETVPNAAGLTLEDYRQEIRDVVLPRAMTDRELFLVEGSVLVPPGAAYFPDGIHPNDAGFAFYANALAGANLVADPGFEADGYAWKTNASAAVVTTDVHLGAKAVRLGPDTGIGVQPIGRLRRAEDYLLTTWSKVAGSGQQGRIALSFFDPDEMLLAKHETTVTWTSYQESMTMIRTPPQFARAEVKISTSPGPSVLHVDDVALVSVAASSDLAQRRGRAGTLGVPALGLTRANTPGAPLTLDVGNSRGLPTIGAVLVSVDPGESGAGGARALSIPISIPADGIRRTWFVPDLGTGTRVSIQVIEADPGARSGVSATPVLRLTGGT